MDKDLAPVYSNLKSNFGGINNYSFEELDGPKTPGWKDGIITDQKPMPTPDTQARVKTDLPDSPKENPSLGKGITWPNGIISHQNPMPTPTLEPMHKV